MSNDLSDRTILITGANSGIGKASALRLAQMGARIILFCRDLQNAENTKKEILAQTPNAHVDFIIADLASLTDIKRVAGEIQSKYPKINVLINNAGVFSQNRTTTKDGFEATFGVNYLGHFTLTLLLIELLKRNTPARIINVSSDIHRFMGINMKDPMSERKYNCQKAYSNSKTALVLFTYALDRRLKEESMDISVNSLHPGHVKTRMTTVDSKIYNFFTKIFNIYVSPAQAAETQVYLASAPDIQNVSGKYFKNSKPIKSHKITYKQDVQDHLWILSKDWIRPIIGEIDQ